MASTTVEIAIGLQAEALKVPLAAAQDALLAGFRAAGNDLGMELVRKNKSIRRPDPNLFFLNIRRAPVNGAKAEPSSARQTS
jgi:hypothetical protein